jgi:hypothetical protein
MRGWDSTWILGEPQLRQKLTIAPNHTLFSRLSTGKMLGCVSWWQFIQRVIDGGGRRGALSRSVATIPLMMYEASSEVKDGKGTNI